MEAAVDEACPAKRHISLWRRTDPDLAARPVVLDLKPPPLLPNPAPPWPGMGKWLRLGSSIILLWKSSKLMGARKSMPSGGVWLASYLVALEVPKLRWELLLLME
jgi:hypothetical protein